MRCYGGLSEEQGNGLKCGQPVEVLGVRLVPLTLERLISLPRALKSQGGRYTVMYANIHVLNTAWHDLQLRAILNAADLVYCDGTGVVLGARWLGYSVPARMTGADWIYPFCERCAKEGLRLYLLGSAPGVAEQAAVRLVERYPGLQVIGTHHGYIHNAPAQSVMAITDINNLRPDVLLVGMGTPVQEKWVAAHRAALDVPLCWVVGALFDYVAGVVPRGPRWMLDHGLEWLYRWWLEPRRLSGRYLVGNPLFFLRLLRQKLSPGRKPGP